MAQQHQARNHATPGPRPWRCAAPSRAARPDDEDGGERQKPPLAERPGHGPRFDAAGHVDRQPDAGEQTDSLPSAVVGRAVRGAAWCRARAASATRSGDGAARRAASSTGSRARARTARRVKCGDVQLIFRATSAAGLRPPLIARYAQACGAAADGEAAAGRAGHARACGRRAAAVRRCQWWRSQSQAGSAREDDVLLTDHGHHGAGAPDGDRPSRRPRVAGRGATGREEEGHGECRRRVSEERRHVRVEDERRPDADGHRRGGSRRRHQASCGAPDRSAASQA